MLKVFEKYGNQLSVGLALPVQIVIFLLILHIFLFALGCSWYFNNFLHNYWNKSPAKK